MRYPLKPSGTEENAKWEAVTTSELKTSASNQVTGVVGGCRSWQAVSIYTRRDAMAADSTSLALINTIGYANSYGLFEQYYVAELHVSVSQISWAGSI